MTYTDKIPQGDRPVDPTHLEALGKQAARLAETGGLSLNDAVTKTIGFEKLNSEQVRRVVEFTNIEAFNRKFAALEGPMRAVQLDGGPADPVQVLQNLNNGARPREVTMEAMDYSTPPTFGKQASAVLPLRDRTRAGLLGEVVALQSKLSSAHDILIQDVEAEKYKLSEQLCVLIERAKSACLAGAHREEVFEAWQREHPELAETAYQYAVPHLPPSAVKVAGRRINPEHSLVASFKDFVKSAQALDAALTAVRNIEMELTKVSSWLSSEV